MNSPAEVDNSNRDIPGSELILIWGLRLLGLVDMLALIAVVMPLEWMSQVNDLCGLETFPESRIVSYLARTTSALYALHGALVLFISFDVDRYRPLITFLGMVAIVHGAILLGIDVAVGMPFFWTMLEAPAFTATGFAVLWVLRQKTPTNAGVPA